MSVEIKQPTDDVIEQAARHLLTGGLVAMPTETVYGLAADAENKTAVARMYAAKGRPADHPVIVHVPDIATVAHWVSDFPEYAKKLAQAFWPGPMTLVLPRSLAAGDFITGNQDTVAIRVPDHPVALKLLNKLCELGGKGVVAPSANRYGAVSPTTAVAVAQELSDYLDSQDFILDGGQCDVGLESTIIDCTGAAPKVLRPGAVTVEMIEQASGTKVAAESGTRIRVSGSHKKHYSPACQVLLEGEPKPGDGLIALEEVATGPGVLRLASPKNLTEYASQLYGALREADHLGLKRVFVFAPAGAGLALALQDRIQRAAAKGEEK